jgi:hypothetical protein
VTCQDHTQWAERKKYWGGLPLSLKGGDHLCGNLCYPRDVHSWWLWTRGAVSAHLSSSSSSFLNQVENYVSLQLLNMCSENSPNASLYESKARISYSVIKSLICGKHWF